MSIPSYDYDTGGVEQGNIINAIDVLNIVKNAGDAYLLVENVSDNTPTEIVPVTTGNPATTGWKKVSGWTCTMSDLRTTLNGIIDTYQNKIKKEELITLSDVKSFMTDYFYELNRIATFQFSYYESTTADDLTTKQYTGLSDYYVEKDDYSISAKQFFVKYDSERLVNVGDIICANDISTWCDNFLKCNAKHELIYDTENRNKKTEDEISVFYQVSADFVNTWDYYGWIDVHKAKARQKAGGIRYQENTRSTWYGWFTRVTYYAWTNINTLRKIDDKDDKLNIYPKYDDTVALLTMYAYPPDSADLSSDKLVYKKGEYASISALPHTYYSFVKWQSNQEPQPAPLSSTSILISADTILSAILSIDTYDITLCAQYGVLSGAGTYDHGEIANLTFIPDYPYKFNTWRSMDGDDNISTYLVDCALSNFAINLSVTQDWTLTAEAAIDIYKPGDVLLDTRKDTEQSCSLSSNALYLNISCSIPTGDPINLSIERYVFNEQSSELQLSVLSSFTITSDQTIIEIQNLRSKDILNHDIWTWYPQPRNDLCAYVVDPSDDV